MSMKGKKTERLKNCNGKQLVDMLHWLADLQFKAWVWIPRSIVTFGMSEKSNKYFFIGSESLYHIFATNNTGRI